MILYINIFHITLTFFYMSFITRDLISVPLSDGMKDVKNIFDNSLQFPKEKIDFKIYH